MEAPQDPAAAVFEPTGELYKDYCAYCETADRDERDDLLDGITLVDGTESPRNASTPHNVHTKLFARGLESPLYRADICPLTNAMPHCANLYTAKFYGCSMSIDSYKLLVEAVFKSPSLVTVAVEFNQTPLGRDPTATKKERAQESYLWPHQAHGGGALTEQHPDAVGKKAPPAPKDAKQCKAPETPVERPPIKVPDGWHALLLTGVQELSLRGNNIGDKQARLIAKGIEGNVNLLSLNLWGNVIGDDGVAALADALRCNTRLTSLNVGDNRVTDAGMGALVASMQQQDVPSADFAALRTKVRTYQELAAPGTMSAEPPPYPSYAELVAACAPAEAVKETKKPPPKGKPGKDAAPTNHVLHPWDKACVRVGDAVRIPGNSTLWSLNVSSNRGVTVEGVRAAIAVLMQGETSIEALAAVPAADAAPVVDVAALAAADKKADKKDAKRKSVYEEAAVQVAAPPLASRCGLARFTVSHPSLDLSVVNELNEALVSLQEAPKAEVGDSPQPP